MLLIFVVAAEAGAQVAAEAEESACWHVAEDDLSAPSAAMVFYGRH